MFSRLSVCLFPWCVIKGSAVIMDHCPILLLIKILYEQAISKAWLLCCPWCPIPYLWPGAEVGGLCGQMNMKSSLSLSPEVTLYLCQVLSKHYGKVGFHVSVHLHLFRVVCVNRVVLCWDWQASVITAAFGEPQTLVAMFLLALSPWPSSSSEYKNMEGMPLPGQVQVLWLPEEDLSLKTWHFTKFGVDEFKNLAAKKWFIPNSYGVIGYIPSHDALDTQ